MAKEFDLEAAKNGAPVQTRDGQKARILCFDKKHADYPIIALYGNGDGEFVAAYTLEGHFDTNTPNHPLDLVMKPTKHEGWANIYKSGELTCICGNIYDSQERAKSAAVSGYVATVKIEWED